MCMFVNIYVYMHIYIYIYIYVYACIYILYSHICVFPSTNNLSFSGYRVQIYLSLFSNFSRVMLRVVSTYIYI